MKQEDFIKIIVLLANELDRQQLDIYIKDQTIAALNKRIEEAEKSTEA